MKSFLFFLFVSFSVSAQYTIREPNAIPLHGKWLFAMDPRQVGEQKGWYTLASNAQGRNWDQVTVPHCFSADPRYQFFTGLVWYKKSFPWQVQTGKRVILHFDAAYYATTLWLNDQKVGTHEGGYTPFSFDITDFLKNGENLLALSITNDTWQEGSIPGSKDGDSPNDPFMGWMNYGGLIRPVYLTIEPEVYLQNLKVEATPDLVKGTATLKVKAFIRNASQQANAPKLSFTLQQNNHIIPVTWKTSSTSIAGSQSGVLEAETSLKAADVKRWDLDDPNLYQLRVAIAGDTLKTSFGIRKVEVKGTQLLLNGQPLKLAGANRVVDYPGLGSLEPDWLIEKDFRLMKEAGMEFQRLTHYTPSERFYELADQYGMLIIAEAGNWQLTPKQMDSDTIRNKFKQQFTEMMQRDWNHPSIIAYSVGNEYLSEQPAGQRWTKDLIAWSRELDPTRLYTFASMRLNILPKRAEDEASQYCDFVSTNTYGNHARALDHIHSLYPDKPVLISEWGVRADANGGEAGQAKHISEVAELIRKRPYVVGASWWTYNDYQSRYVGTAPNGYRPWGLVGPDRTPRPAYAVYRREMAPLTLEKVRWQPGGQGVHELVIKVTARGDFPAYTLRNYRIKTPDQTVLIPELKPGASAEVRIPVVGFDRTLTLDVWKPTGVPILTETIHLTETK